MPPTGPRTAKGKAVSRANGVKHGLTATNIVIKEERLQDWRAFHDAVLRDFAVVGPVESALASRIAELLWRSRRIGVQERQDIDVAETRHLYIAMDEERVANELKAQSKALGRAPEDPAPGPQRPILYSGSIIVSAATDRYQRSLPVRLPNPNELERIIRYEAHLARQLSRAMHQLAVMLRRRLGDSASTPAISLGGLLEM